MIKILEDLLIEATTSPNAPSSLVAGLRKAVDAARCGSVKGKTFAFSSVLPTLSRDEACSRIEEAGGAIVSAVSAKLDYLVAGSEAGSKLLKALELGVPVIGEKQLQAMLPASYKQLAALQEPPVVLGYDKLIGALRTAPPPAAADLLPPPFDSLEEAQRAEGVGPRAYRVCVREHGVCMVGDVIEDFPQRQFSNPENWLPCDKDGWVSGRLSGQEGLATEWRDHPGLSDWRPVRTPKPSAIDEMAEQMKRWAAPTREDFDKALNDLSEAMGVPKRRLLGQAREVPLESEDAKPTNPKDAAATDRVPLGLLSPIAKAHWALAQHCGRAKYGAWNWREAGVRASVYIDAIGRHTDGYLSGETYDPADGTHHLGNIMACCAILLEAEAAGKLTDDRPPALDMRPTYAEVQRRMADLTTKYADRNPKHWTR